MPGSPKKKKGGKKDSGKDKELEEQKKKQAEDDRKVAEERERKEREIQEAKNTELLERLFSEEKDRIEVEKSEIRAICASKGSELQSLLRKIEEEIEWKKFVECNPLPSPKIERDVNTYLSLWDEESLVSNQASPSLESLFVQLTSAEQLLEHLEVERASVQDKQNGKEVERLQGHMSQLLQILYRKWDEATQETLQHMDYFTDDPSENFQIMSIVDNHAFGLWGNVTRNPRNKFIEFSEIGMTCSIPKPIVLSNVAIRMIYCSGPNAGILHEIQETETHRSFVGGILLLDLMELPEQAKKLEKCTIRQIASKDGSIRRVEYPFKKQTAEVADDGEENAAGDMTVFNATVIYYIPPNPFLDQKSVKVMWWNSEYKMWDDEGITDDDIELETGKVKFRTLHFAPIAVVQNTFAEFPFADWELTPTGLNRSILNITGKNNALSIEIGEGACQLLRSDTEYLQKFFKDQWFAPSLLFKRLSQIGLNFSGPKSMKNVEMENIVLKQPAVEEQCISGISLCASALCFRRSPSNKNLSSSKCVFQFRENFHHESTENEWRSVVFDANYKVKDDIYQIGFIPPNNNVTDDVKIIASGEDSSTVRASTYHLLKPQIKDSTNIERFEKSSAIYIQTVTQVLQATRVLCFS